MDAWMRRKSMSISSGACLPHGGEERGRSGQSFISLRPQSALCGNELGCLSSAPQTKPVLMMTDYTHFQHHISILGLHYR